MVLVSALWPMITAAVEYRAAMAASVILMALTALAILTIERLRVGDVGTF